VEHQLSPELDAIADLGGLSDLVRIAEVEAQARDHYTETDSYQANLASRYRRLHHYYAPFMGDQWPEDAATRPGKIHITADVCKAAVDVDARLQAILPRISSTPSAIDPGARKAAESAEKVILRFLELSEWDIWLSDLAKTKCVYGKGVLKPFWNIEEGRPDLIVIETPENLRLGWGTSDFRSLDWALYEYAISPLEAMRRFPDIEVSSERGDNVFVVRRGGDHADPLDQMLPTGGRTSMLDRPTQYTPSEYERKQVRVWDYWFRDVSDDVWNATLVEGVIAGDIKKHPEMASLPFIVIENDHEPGSPEGMATHELLIDIQIELNRALSHWAQLVADEIDPAFQLAGENADSVPDGMVPRGGEIIATGMGNEIKPIPKGVNLFPVQQFVSELWQEYHRISGLAEILFGQSPGAQTTGRALAVQVEAAANRLDFKRRRLYQGLRHLILFWIGMLEKVNPKVTVATPEGGTAEIGLGDIVKGVYRWKIIAPEITPKDVIENTGNVINKVNAKIISLKSGRDELGIDSPEDEEDLIVEERSNAHLFPGDVQTFVAVMAALQAMQAQAAALQQPAGAVPTANDQTGQNAATAAAQQAQPTLGQDQNQGGQPMTQAGMAPPGGGPMAQPGAPPTGATATTLVRSQPTGQAVALNQIAYKRPL